LSRETYLKVAFREIKSAELSLPSHNAKMAAMETLNTTGTWWVPSKGQSRVAGTLTFSENDGIQLEIDKSLEFEKEKIVLGRAGGREITLQGPRKGVKSFVNS
jgi:hypothetical protein